VKGYYVGGKTGTSEKVVNGRYSKTKVLNTFTASCRPTSRATRLLIMLDEPKALPETHGFITSGWNAVPTGGKVIARIAPLLGIEPRFDLPPSDRLFLRHRRNPVRRKAGCRRPTESDFLQSSGRLEGRRPMKTMKTSRPLQR
jgi:cell division protein FtsI (penicillin-binding protein 3)